MIDELGHDPGPASSPGSLHTRPLQSNQLPPHHHPLRLSHHPTNKPMLRNNQHLLLLAPNRRPHSRQLPPHPQHLTLDAHRAPRGRRAQERQREGARHAEVGPRRVGDVAEGERREEVDEGGRRAAREAGERVAVGGLDRVEEGRAGGRRRGGGVVGYVADEVGVVGLEGPCVSDTGPPWP